MPAALGHSRKRAHRPLDDRCRREGRSAGWSRHDTRTASPSPLDVEHDAVTVVTGRHDALSGASAASSRMSLAVRLVQPRQAIPHLVGVDTATGDVRAPPAPRATGPASGGTPETRPRAPPCSSVPARSPAAIRSHRNAGPPESSPGHNSLRSGFNERRQRPRVVPPAGASVMCCGGLCPVLGRRACAVTRSWGRSARTGIEARAGRGICSWRISHSLVCRRPAFPGWNQVRWVSRPCQT